MRTTAAVTSLLLLLALTTASSGVQDDTAKVGVTVFFEALCPDSRRFIVHQLYPVWRSIGDVMEVDLHAHGKSWETDAGEFTCQHGERECAANLMITCAQNVTRDSQALMKFIHCVMQKSQGVDGGLLCANETGVDYSDVEECMRSDVGVKLQHNIGERQAQLDPRLSYVPWILIDDEFTEKTLTEAQDDLMRVVCDAYKGPTPEACQE
ncbi:gamma-interferon-inducible lysosomal thiol reductase-like [Portunus trituberculatus]|uniref:gamma-interferon-inducible lysosomal thiol reductase-like n=1 Tax=Portunus trituberculatus TaxID=210409 RepID=UPI001E1CDA17|nr:gamma-interferon-inducible lysosomal thiol reductase-like [Portunus trituberculatus]